MDRQYQTKDRAERMILALRDDRLLPLQRIVWADLIYEADDQGRIATATHVITARLGASANTVTLALERLAVFDIIHLEWDRSSNAAPPYLRARTHQNRRAFTATLQGAKQ
jgi:hypothetical protein